MDRPTQERRRHAEIGQDCNVGLLNQVLYAVTKRRIQRLQATYSRLTVVDLASKVGLGDDVDQVTVMLEEMVGAVSLTPRTYPAHQ